MCLILQSALRVVIIGIILGILSRQSGNSSETSVSQKYMEPIFPVDPFPGAGGRGMDTSYLDRVLEKFTFWWWEDSHCYPSFRDTSVLSYAKKLFSSYCLPPLSFFLRFFYLLLLNVGLLKIIVKVKITVAVHTSWSIVLPFLFFSQSWPHLHVSTGVSEW